MSSEIIDRLARALAADTSRRGWLRGSVGAGALALVASALGREPVAADKVDGEACLRVPNKCKKRKLRCCGNATCVKGRCRCKRNYKRCRHACIPKTQCCGNCPEGTVCVNGECAGCGAGGPCTIFTTSTTHSGELGGVAGADTICQQRAAEAGLTGTYLAWIADDTTAPADRLYQSPGEYLRTDGLRIARNWAELTGGILGVPIDRSETGALIADSTETWTNVSADGTASATDPSLICNNWTNGTGGTSGRVGATNQVDEDWTYVHSDPCNSQWRLYCVQQN